MVLFLLAYSGAAGRRQFMDRDEILRVKRLSDRLRREMTLPFD
jgi:hypothetical protein